MYWSLGENGGLSREKQERLDEIIGLLRRNDGHLRFSQLYETLAYRYGTAESTVWGYLGVLKRALGLCRFRLNTARAGMSSLMPTNLSSRLFIYA